MYVRGCTSLLYESLSNIITATQLIYLKNNKVTRMVICIYTIMAEVLRRNIYYTVNVVFSHVPPLQFGAKDEDHCSTQTNVYLSVKYLAAFYTTSHL